MSRHAITDFIDAICPTIACKPLKKAFVLWDMESTAQGTLQLRNWDMGETKHGLLHTATLSFNWESNFQIASVLDKATEESRGEFILTKIEMFVEGDWSALRLWLGSTVSLSIDMEQTSWISCYSHITPGGGGQHLGWNNLQKVTC